MQVFGAKNEIIFLPSSYCACITRKNRFRGDFFYFLLHMSKKYSNFAPQNREEL